MKLSLIKRLGAATAAAAAMIAIATQPGMADTKPIKIGWTAWSDAEAVTKLAKKVIETRLDQPVELVLADIGLQYQGVAKGDLDAMLMSWLPVTHESYVQKLGDKLVPLGILYTGAKLGWVVPDYVPADQLRTIEDLKKADVRKQLGGKIQGIDPGAGLMQASEKTIEAYGLKDYNLLSASGAAMTAALKRAIDRKEWIVVTGWSPHWKFAQWKLRYLEDPKGTLGGLERVHVMARPNFYQDHPKVAEFFARMYLPLDELQALMFEANQTSYEAAVDKYIAEHKARIDYWVTGNVPTS